MNNVKIKQIIFQGRHTIIQFEDGSKQVVACTEGDTNDPFVGFCVAFAERYFGGKAEIRKLLKAKSFKVKTAEEKALSKIANSVKNE